KRGKARHLARFLQVPRRNVHVSGAPGNLTAMSHPRLKPQSMDNAPDFTPLVLLIDDQEWTSRSIESILRPKGHVVLKAYTGQQALELVTKVNPDVVIVDVHLPDID